MGAELGAGLEIQEGSPTFRYWNSNRSALGPPVRRIRVFPGNDELIVFAEPSVGFPIWT